MFCGSSGCHILYHDDGYKLQVCTRSARRRHGSCQRILSGRYGCHPCQEDGKDGCCQGRQRQAFENKARVAARWLEMLSRLRATRPVGAGSRMLALLGPPRTGQALGPDALRRVTEADRRGPDSGPRRRAGAGEADTML